MVDGAPENTKLFERSHRRTISVIMTVKNDGLGCAVTLGSLARQTLLADEIIVVDGGSSDETVSILGKHKSLCPGMRILEAPESNIARGRNIAAEAARGEILACIDSGCRAESTWLASLAKPFEDDTDVDFVAGTYCVEADTFFEQVVGLATMRGALDQIDPETFNPSARSMACTKRLWSEAGGWPEWLSFSEDTLFDYKVRSMGVEWRLAGDAVVGWKPRSTLGAVWKQFRNYGTGRGHTQIGACDFRYNLRNIFLNVMCVALVVLSPMAIPLLLFSLFYCYVWTFHEKAKRIAMRTRRMSGYPLCLLIMWVVMGSNLVGYLVGSYQRWVDQDRFARPIRAYMTGLT